MPRPRRSRYQPNEALNYGYAPDMITPYNYVTRQYYPPGYDYGTNQTFYPAQLQSYGYGSGQTYHASCYPGSAQSQGCYPVSDAYSEPVYDAYGDYSGHYDNYSSDYNTNEAYYSDIYDTNPSSTSTARHQQRSYHTPRPLPSHSPSPTPPPPPPPPPRSPSPTYLHTSLTPSTPLQNPSTSRKLLILDLNGTLLIRSARPRPVRKRIFHNHHNHQNYPPPPRTVHPRPYLPAFVEYLFHPENVKWLDTMVWSSAQPHSVSDMVDKCFGERQGELVAVWARDRMGLSSADYHRKTQTTKDLNKPWTELARSQSPSSRSMPPSSSSPPPPPSSSPPDPDSPTPLNTSPNHRHRHHHHHHPHSHPHSAITTLLLDDSPLKATLQPYNHVCIHEYDSSLRANDLKVLEGRLKKERNEKGKVKERKRQRLEEREMMLGEEEEEDQMRKEVQKEVGEEIDGMGELENGVSISMESNKKGRRKEKEKAKNKNKKKAVEEKNLMKLNGQPDPLDPEAHSDGGRTVDHQIQMDQGTTSTVGGDPSPLPTPSRKRKRQEENASQDTGVFKDPEEQLELSTAAEAQQSPLPLPPPDPDPTTSTLKFDQTLLAVIGVLDALKLESNVAGWIRSGRLLFPNSAVRGDGGVGLLDADSQPPPPKMKKQKKQEKREKKTGDESVGEENDDYGECDISTGTSAPTTNTMWFTHAPTMDHWARKGVEALVALGIEVVDGIDR